MFTNQISSLKTLDCCYGLIFTHNIPFLTYPKAIVCLKDLSELFSDSDVCSEFFYQTSQICHNLQFLGITIRGVISDGLANLISVQQNLKYLKLINHSVPSITNHLIGLYIYG